LGYVRFLDFAGCSSHDIKDLDLEKVPTGRYLPVVDLGKLTISLCFPGHDILTIPQAGAAAYSAMMQLAYHNGFGRHSSKPNQRSQAVTLDID
jgi:hypothetical protein